MRLEESIGAEERLVLTAMIVDGTVLGAVAARQTAEGLFPSAWSNLVARWCIDYQRAYDRPPGKAIEAVYRAWAATKADEDTARIVETFLEGLSAEYERADAVNSQWVLDRAGAYFDKVRLRKLSRRIDDFLEAGEVAEAQAAVRGHGPVELGGGGGVRVSLDEEDQRRAFDGRRELLIKLPGPRGVFFGDALERDSFIGIMSPEKRGKTWNALDLAWHAMAQGRRTLFVEAGDLSQDQMMRRFCVRAAHRPGPSRTRSWPYCVRYPVGVRLREKILDVTHKRATFTAPLDADQAVAAMKKVRDKAGDTLRLYTFPCGSLSVDGIKALVDDLNHRDWLPDVLVLDYADILAKPPGHKGEPREAVNLNWAALRGLSQQLHGCVITPTQANAASYHASTLSISHFSEDHRKFAHVTGMVGLSQSEREKSEQVLRLNWLVLREEEFSSGKCCHLAGCLAVGNPCVLSAY